MTPIIWDLHHLRQQTAAGWYWGDGNSNINLWTQARYEA
jgi:hypothetical protein